MLKETLKDKTVLVTGGTGSFGKNFVRHLLAGSEVKKVIVFSRDEFKQSVMQQEINDERLRFFLGDIRDLPRLQRAFHEVNLVVHAAALKQVPTLEYNPFEAVKTNVIGSQNVVDAAIDQRVEKVLLISTDKAVQPVNLYGSTKLCAEKLFISGNSYSGGRTKFSCTRYGNIIGSRGGIVEALINSVNLKKVFITDERMTRFWLSLSQSFSLVSFALANMEGGEIFIPKIPSMKLIDLFDCLAPGKVRETIGIRPGEKLHEVLLTQEEARHSLELDDCYVILPEFIFSDEIKSALKKYLVRGKKLEANFKYSSDDNWNWLKKEEFNELIKNL